MGQSSRAGAPAVWPRIDPGDILPPVRFSYHTHSEFCDGKSDAASMADAAFRAGYRIIGFSSHAPLPFETSWNLKWSRIEEYGAAIRALAACWKPRGLDILLGLEADWIRDTMLPSDPRLSVISPDFIIGSTHFVGFGNGTLFAVDEPETDFDAHVRAEAGGDGTRVWREYYRNLASMIESGGFDIVGHFDLVKKNNRGGRWFDESAPAYVDAAFQAADAAAERGLVAEVNPGGITRGKTDDTYPSHAILARMFEKGLRLTLGDDAHHTSHIGAQRRAAISAARDAGYRSLWYLSPEKEWKEIGLEEADRV